VANRRRHHGQPAGREDGSGRSPARSASAPLGPVVGEVMGVPSAGGPVVTADATNRGVCCSLTGPAIRTLRDVGHGVRFEPPTGGRPRLIRPRLLDRLRHRFTTPVTLVAAPAGFGKTTLLGQAIEENRLAPHGLDRWLTCHADDGAASSLSDGLGRALGLEPSGVTEPVVSSLVEAMWHRSPDEVALVLDDVQEIPAHSAGAEVLTRLVASLPRNGHVVLSGREPIPVALTRLEVQGHLLRLNESDLRFTDHELAEFAAQRDVTPDQVARCGGWPALAEIAASAVPGVGAAYVWEEVLARIDPDRRRDLALLAHIGNFDDVLAAAAVDRDVDLDSLTADFPLVSRTSRGDWSIHSLWQPLLAREVSEAAVADARRRAGIALAADGDVAAAVRLLTKAAAWEDVTNVVVDALGAALPPVPGDIVTAWLGRLPDSRKDAPLGRLLDAVSTVQTDPGRAAQRLDEAAASFRGRGDLQGELACISQLAQLAWWSEQPERMAAIAARVFEMEAAGHAHAVPLACLARALIADLANNSTAALAELDRIAPGSLNHNWQSLVDWLRSTSLNHLGRPAEALDAAEGACAFAGPLHAPLVETARLQALWYLGRVDDVVDEFPELVDRATAVGLRNYAALMAASCCLALAVVGRPQEASRYLERARRIAASREIPLVDVNLTVAQAAVAIESGDEPGAARVLESYLARSPLLGAGHAAAPQQRALALWYVLVPTSREVWEAASLGPCFVTARDLAQAVVGIRAGEPLRLRPADLPAPGVVRAHLPLPWSTELALALIAGGHQAGWDILEALWPAAQVHVRHQVTGGPSALAGAGRLALARLPKPPTGHLELRLLGPIELRRDGGPVDAPDWRRGRVRSLIAHLVLHRSVTRDRIAGDLWPQLDGNAQLRNLRITLTYLLRVLEPGRADRDASFFIRSHGNSLLLDRGEWLDTDVWRFDDLWSAATQADRLGNASVALDSMHRAVALWRGDPSELANEDWALPEVEERRLRLVDLASRAGELSLAKGQPEDARRCGQLALSVDPWSERAHYLVVAGHHAAGDDHAARRALERYHDRLHELGIDPATDTGMLQRLAGQLEGADPRRL
jgi:LuxR family transcriptional regulator, maltose regulon positive regulatory protein